MNAATLADFDLFSQLDEPQRGFIARRLAEEKLPAGAHIFAEGDPGEKLYLVLDGCVRISKMVADGEEALAMLRKGAHFGEMSLLDDQPRSAEAVVHEDATLLTLTRQDFADLLELDPRLAVGILKAMLLTLNVRLRETNDQVKAMHLMSMW